MQQTFQDGINTKCVKCNLKRCIYDINWSTRCILLCTSGCTSSKLSKIFCKSESRIYMHAKWYGPMVLPWESLTRLCKCHFYIKNSLQRLVIPTTDITVFTDASETSLGITDGHNMKECILMYLDLGCLYRYSQGLS